MADDSNVIPISGPSLPNDDPLIIDPKAPLATARHLIEIHHTAKKLKTLLHQQSVFMIWTGTHYRELPTEEVRLRIYAFLEHAKFWAPLKKDPDKFEMKAFKPSARSVSDVLDALRAAAQVEGLTRPPSWLVDADSAPSASEIISCKNGLLHLPTGKLLSHTPNFYSNSALGYNYDKDAPEPVAWFNFLATIWPDDAQAIATLQDIFGYMIGSDTDQQKIPLLVGPKRSGKGTLGRTLTALVGQDAVVSPTLASLEKNFGIAPLIGKSIALVADARLGGSANQQGIAERLLSISGEDIQTIDRKNLSAWTGRLPTRFFIMTNELPRISDSSGALASRFLLVTMTRSFFGHEDHTLGERLLQELPGILNWAIDGWKRIRERKHFLQPQSSIEAMQDLEDLGSPIGAFLRDSCIIEQGKSVSVDLVYEAWEVWCKSQGRAHTGTKQTFGRDLRSVVPGLTTVQSRIDGDERIRKYEGLALKEKVIWERERPDPFDP